MRIYSMTATFGKLSHQTLYLEPGLNIISAPNEWGKSTWCAFLIAMLYGIDTRQQTTKTALAEKERFAPWSGEPMSGRMELSWNGRDITIERSTKGRIPFGQFRAYETATGLDVPELTAANCGQLLLGVEKSVFTRSGFIRLQDMPVTQDESLRRRLNNLVTTGDESGAGDQLGKQLRELKNNVRYNRTGLLPQAEAERDRLREQLEQKEALVLQTRQLQERQVQLEEIIKALENHADALRYEAAQQGVQQLQDAQDTCTRLLSELSQLEEACAAYPSPENVQQAIAKGQELLSQQRALLVSQQQLPQAPVAPEIPGIYRNETPEQAIASAEADYRQLKALKAVQAKKARLPMIFGIGAALLLAVLIACFAASILPIAVLCIGGGLIVAACAVGIILSTSQLAKSRQASEALYQKRPGIQPEEWASHARSYGKSQEGYRLAMEQHQAVCGSFTQRQQVLEEAIREYAPDQTLDEALAHWEHILQQHTLLTTKRREWENAQQHAAAMQSVATTAPEPAFPDTLTLSAPETQAHLQTARFEQNQLQIKLGECIGQANTLRPEKVLREQLDMLNRRIGRLEDYYRALELAQEVLHQAVSALQRRFAPRISKRAQDIFSRLTGGRYQKLTLSDDLSLHASAENEDTLHSTQWRSDGTVDQLYLSLRLAVADELIPDAPLVLDDALIRFDDDRLQAALTVLGEEAEHKQVIVFSCQSREKELTKQIGNLSS